MCSYYRRLKQLFENNRAQDEGLGWGFIIALVIAMLAIIFMIWFSRQSGRSILDILRGIV